jgi:hypothetical protein
MEEGIPCAPDSVMPIGVDSRDTSILVKKVSLSKKL